MVLGELVLNPEVTFVAIGALSGVILTAFTQGLNASLQRRSDQVLKSFEARVETIASLLLSMFDVSDIEQELTVFENHVDLMNYRNQVRLLEEFKEAATVLSAKFGAIPSPTPEVIIELRAEASETSERVRELMKSVEQMEPRVKQLDADLKEKQERLRMAKREIRKQGIKLQLLLNHKKLKAGLRKLIEAIDSGRPLGPTDCEEFVAEAAKVIGIAR